MGDATIRGLLREGYGSEDIALRLNMPRRLVLQTISFYRDRGILRAIYGMKAADEGEQPRAGLTETAQTVGESDGSQER